MSVDVTIFGADLPAGTYTRGDVVTLQCTDGPAVVRSGRGSAILKRITSLKLTNQSGSDTLWKIRVKNSDWIDPSTSLSAELPAATALDRRTSAVISGHDCPLTPNSAWFVEAVCVAGGTTTVANSIVAVIEVDYPQVASIIDPDRLAGIPASIEHTETGITINAPGTLTTSKWDTVNVDFFKAGFQYALEKLELISQTVHVTGFIAISNAAGMGGLTRIIPISNPINNIRPLIEYASSLVKGPMDIKYKLFNNGGTSATTDTIQLVFDFVKRRI